MQRNTGIDFLKILCMIMIVVLHILKASGMLSQGDDPVRYSISWLLETLSYCAVNCYGLITGYLMIDKKFKLSRIISLWLQVLFYSAGIMALFEILMPDQLTKQDFFTSLLPVTSSTYWYMTAYVFLFFLMPFLNVLLNNLSRYAHKALLIATIILFSIVPVIVNYDIFYTYDGYCFIWLAVLYIMGAYIRKYGMFKGFHAIEALVIYLLASAVAWISLPYYRMQWINYTSPLILLAAVMLFLWSIRVSWKGSALCKTISFFAPLSFSTYLIHTHPLLWRLVLSVWLVKYQAIPLPGLIPAIIGTAIIILIGCSLVELLRSKLFSLFRMNRLYKMIDRKLDAFWNPPTKHNTTAD